MEMITDREIIERFTRIESKLDDVLKGTTAAAFEGLSKATQVEFELHHAEERVEGEINNIKTQIKWIFGGLATIGAGVILEIVRLVTLKG